VVSRCTNDDGMFVCRLYLVSDILYINGPSVISCAHDKGSTDILCIMNKSVVSWCAYDEESMGVTDGCYWLYNTVCRWY